MGSTKTNDVARSVLTGFIWGVCSPPFVVFFHVILFAEMSDSRSISFSAARIIFLGFGQAALAIWIGISNFKHRVRMRCLEKSGILWR